MLSITTKVEVSYAHDLPEHEGECKNLHGHNATIEVEVGVPDDTVFKTGMVLDFAELRKTIFRDIVGRLDHKYLNKTLPDEFMPPTAENIILWIKSRLLPAYGDALFRIRVYETSKNWAEWKK